MVDIYVPALSVLLWPTNCSCWLNVIMKKRSVGWADSENIPAFQCSDQVSCMSLGSELP